MEQVELDRVRFRRHHREHTRLRGLSCSNLYKNKLMTAGRLLAVLDMRPSTTIKGAAPLTPSTTNTLIWGPVSAPN